MKKLLIILLLSSCSKDKIIEPVATDCKDTISFINQILPMMTNNCVGCHDMETSNGFVFDNYAAISDNADRVLNGMKGEGGIPQMPLGGTPLADSLIQNFSCWIDQGKLNN